MGARSIPAVILLACLAAPAAQTLRAGGLGQGGEAWTVPLRRVSAVSWSPNGSLLAVGAGDAVLILNSSGSVVSEAELGGEVLDVSWMPGSVVASTARGLFRAYPGPVEEIFSLSGEADASILEPSPDGGLMAAAWGWSRGLEEGGVLALVDPSGGVAARLDLPSSPSDLDWRPDGSALAVGTVGGITLAVSRSGERLWITDVRSARPFANTVRSVEWVPNGTLLSEGLGPRFVDFLRAETGGLAGYFTIPGMPAGIDWTQEGDLLCAGAGDRIAIVSRSGEQIWVSDAFISPPKVIGWSPDGDSCLAISQKWALAVSRDGETLWFASPGDRVVDAEWGPAGAAVALAWESGVGVFAARPQRIELSADPLVPAGETEVEIRLFNPLPWSIDARLDLSVGGSGAGSLELEASPGWNSWNATLDLPPGEVEVGALAETPLGAASASTRVSAFLPPEVNLSVSASPGGPAEVRALIHNPNPSGGNCSASLLIDGAPRDGWSGPCPYGWTEASWEVPLDPGAHGVEVSLEFLGVEVRSGTVEVRQPADRVEVSIGRPSGVWGEVSVPVRASNPYDGEVDLTLEVWVDGVLAASRNLTLPPRGEETLRVPLPGGDHEVYSRALWLGRVLGEARARVSVLPAWLPVAAAGAAAALALALLMRRIRGAREDRREALFRILAGSPDGGGSR